MPSYSKSKAVVTQNDREEVLMESLDKVSAKLPVIEFYNTTFPTGEMKLAVARIYADVMGLLDEALNYHRNSRLGRASVPFQDPCLCR